MLTVDVQPPALYNSLHDLIRMAFPEAKLQQEQTEGRDGHIVIKCADQGDRLSCIGSIKMNDYTTKDQQDYFKTDENELNNQIKRLVRSFTYRLLCQHLGRNFNTYGVLTGVRPVKIVHRFMDEGLDADSIKKKLAMEYHVNSEKAGLLIDVANANRPFLLSQAEAQKKISIYIGIPFCPSRCYYCSFPGAVLKDYEEDISPFMNSLLLEMNIIGDYIKNNGLTVQTIYLGGGTPTVLNEKDLANIFNILHSKYISNATEEITLEAGRPDTLSLPLLRLMQQAGVNRVCINPQTMNDDTLKFIGRKHNCHMVIESAEWARAAGIKHINMDLIVGLPGETRKHFLISAERISYIKPDNVTVHTMAVKRGSSMIEMEGRASSLERAAEVGWGIDFFYQFLKQQGYKPYYLYRQKFMKASMENTGYALTDSFCIYNIQMIEERQTIIGLGGGASSKFVDTADWTLTSFHNPKDPCSYSKTVRKLIAGKVDKLRALI